MSAPELDIEQGVTNLLHNGGMEEWGASAPASWSLAGAGGTAAEDNVNFAVGTASCKLTRAAADVTLTQNIAGVTLPLTYIQGRTFTLSARVKKDTGKKARIKLDDGVGTTVSGYACDTAAFMVLSVTRVADASATQLAAVLEVYDLAGDCWFDAVMLTEGPATPSFTPNPADAADPMLVNPNPPGAPTGLAVTPKPLTAILTWTANGESDVIGYDLQRADDAGFTTNLASWRVGGTRFEDTLADATTRYWHVRAVRYGGAVSAYSAAVNVAVTKIDTAHIENLAVETAQINDLAVTTLKINGSAVTTEKVNANAITQLLAGYDASALNWKAGNPPAYEYTLLATAPDITTVGGPVLISVSGRLAYSSAVGTGVDYAFGIYRDGSLVSYWQDGGIGDGDWVFTRLTNYLDSPAAGTYSYTFYVRTQSWVSDGGGNNTSCTLRGCQAVELKR